MLKSHFLMSFCLRKVDFYAKNATLEVEIFIVPSKI